MGSYTYSPTAASNTSVDGIGAQGSDSPDNIDNLVRALAASDAALVRDLGGANTVAGTADAITVALADPSAATAYFDGMIFAFRVATDSTTTTPTLNVDSIGAKTIKKTIQGVESALVAGDLQAGQTAVVVYRSAWASAAGAFELLNPSIASSVEVGHATDTTLSRNAAGVLQVEGNIIQSAANGPFAGLRNSIINGCFRINQRAAASNADDTYAHDRWNILTQTGTVAASTQTLVENGTANMMRITQSQVSAQRFGVEQILEAANSYPLRGQAVTLSARVRMSASTTLRFAVLEWTGTADTVTSDVVLSWTSGTFTAGNFFLASNLTVTATGSQALTANTLTSISLNATIGSSANNIIVLFWTDSTQAQNVTLDIGNVQLEIGSVVTPFERRPYTAELEMCKRYYQFYVDLNHISYAQGAGGMFLSWLLPVEMFAAATPSFSNITYNNAATLANATTTSKILKVSIVASVTGATGVEFDVVLASEL